MYTKEIRARFKDELTAPGAFCELQWDPLKHGPNPKSFRSTVIYAAMSLGMKIRTEFQGTEMICQRVDVPYPDSDRMNFDATLKSDMDAAVNLINLLHPMPGDDHYELKAALVRIAERSISQHSITVQRHLEETAEERARLMETHHED